MIQVGQSDLMKGFPSLNTFLCKKTYKQSNYRQDCPDIAVAESLSVAMLLVAGVNEIDCVRKSDKKAFPFGVTCTHFGKYV